jgi:hypothetical protein
MACVCTRPRPTRDSDTSPPHARTAPAPRTPTRHGVPAPHGHAARGTRTRTRRHTPPGPSQPGLANPQRAVRGVLLEESTRSSHLVWSSSSSGLGRAGLGAALPGSPRRRRHARRRRPTFRRSGRRRGHSLSFTDVQYLCVVIFTLISHVRARRLRPARGRRDVTPYRPGAPGSTHRQHRRHMAHRWAQTSSGQRERV